MTEKEQEEEQVVEEPTTKKKRSKYKVQMKPPRKLSSKLSKTKVAIEERLRRYADSYIATGDPVKAYVEGGYVKTEEEAKKCVNYTKPLKSTYVIKYILERTGVDVTQLVKKREMQTVRGEAVAHLFRTYRDTSEDGINIKEFLIDVINTPRYAMRDRLQAVKLFLQYKHMTKNADVLPDFSQFFQDATYR